MNINDRPSDGTAPDAVNALEGIAKSLKSLGSERNHPPVEKWNPPYCGEIGLRIASDGTWFYQGSPIGRRRLVELFASVLRKDDDGRHYLVTPVEKIGIDVDDAPFLAVEMSVTGEGCEQLVSFRTNCNDVVMAGADNPLRFQGEGASDGLKPYVLVRGKLEALVTRALYYDLIEIAVEEERDGGWKLGVWSGGQFFVVSDALSDD